MIVPSTALMIGGAVLGGFGGAEANKKRIQDQQDELDILKMREKQNAQELKASVIGLRNNVENQTIQATQGARSEAVAAFQNESSVSAAAGASGLQGGTPFYKMGQVAADAAQVIRENTKMRANQMSTTEAQGAAEISGIKTNALILGKQEEAAQKSMSYLSSQLGWAQSILTGAMSGASAANSISTALTSAGVPMGDEIGVKAADEVPNPYAAQTDQTAGTVPASITDAPPVYSGLDLTSVFSGDHSSPAPDFGAIVNGGISSMNGVADVGAWGNFGSGAPKQSYGPFDGGIGLGDVPGIDALKKRAVPNPYNVFANIEL